MDKAWLLPPLPVHLTAVPASLLIVRPDVPPDLTRARAPRGHPGVAVFVIWALTDTGNVYLNNFKRFYSGDAFNTKTVFHPHPFLMLLFVFLALLLKIGSKQFG